MCIIIIYPHLIRSSGEMLSEAVEGMVKKYVAYFCLCEFEQKTSIWEFLQLLTSAL